MILNDDEENDQLLGIRNELIKCIGNPVKYFEKYEYCVEELNNKLIIGDKNPLCTIDSKSGFVKITSPNYESSINICRKEAFFNEYENISENVYIKKEASFEVFEIKTLEDLKKALDILNYPKLHQASSDYNEDFFNEDYLCLVLNRFKKGIYPASSFNKRYVCI